MESSNGQIRIAIVLGSVRPGNYTSMAARLAAEEFTALGAAVDIIDPSELELPPPGLGSDSAAAKDLQKRITGAAAVVLATPEYHGSFSSVIKLAIENMGFPSVLAGKPVALLGVAAGAIGAIKSLESLRGVVSHVGGLPLPMAVSVANVQRVFIAEGECLDAGVERHIRRLSTNVLDFLARHICPAITLERVLREGVETK